MTDLAKALALDDALQDLARRVLDEEAPDLDNWQGRDWHRSGIHSALQFLAHVRGMSGTADDLVALERFGRDVARLQVEERPI